MWICLLIAVAAAAGALVRYGIVAWLGGTAWAIFAVNILGCLGFGLFMGIFPQPSPALRAAVTTGFLGAFTTFSTYAWDGWQHLRSGSVAYLLSSLAAGLAAVALGQWLGSVLRAQ